VTLRANPFPQITDPPCQLPLVTLFYRPEASHLGALLPSWVRPRARAYCGLRILKELSRAHRTLQQWRHSAGLSGLSSVRLLQGPSHPVNKRRPLLPGLLLTFLSTDGLHRLYFGESMVAVQEYPCHTHLEVFRIDSSVYDCR